MQPLRKCLLSVACVVQGLLSMANTGPNTNTAHFSIMIGPSPHLNGKYTIFGEVVNGFEVRGDAEVVDMVLRCMAYKQSQAL